STVDAARVLEEYCMQVYFFFFSSRRRHTRFSRDWSSDVCSSDLSPSTWASIELDTNRTPSKESTIFLCPSLSTRSKSSSPTFSRSEERRVGKECRSGWAP